MIWHRKSVFEKNKFASNIKLTWDWIKRRSAMKKKFMIIVFFVFIIILGIFIYKSVEKDHDDWGIRLKVQDVSATEVRLSAERDSDESNGKIIVGDSYGLDKWTLQGWTSLVKDQSTARKRHKIPVESSKQWKVDWELEVGSLQSGVYRITKRVAKSSGVKEGKLPTELEEKTLAVSFCVISKELKMAAGIVIGLFVVAIYLWRHREVLHIIGQWFKVGKRLKIILYASLCIFLFVTGVVLYSHIRWANDELGIRMKITSLPIREGVVGYKIQRNDNEIPYRMYTTNKEEVDKWTITGWENVISRSKIESTTMYELKEPESEMEEDVWLYYFEKRFPIGLYRVRQNVTIENSQKDDVIYSAYFFLISWWEILIGFVLTVGIGIMVWGLRKKKIQIFKKIKWKKMILGSMGVFGVILIASPFVFYNYERDVAEYMRESGTRITDAQAEYLQIYPCLYKGIVDKETEEVDSALTPIELTAEQRKAVQDILEDKYLSPYPKLWYRYDAVIAYGNVVEFQLDLENGIIYWNGGYVGYSRSCINPQEVIGYVKIFEEENHILKDILSVQ